MTATLRDRAEHAARYGANLVVPARDLLQLLNELRSTEAVLTYTRETTRLAIEAVELAEADRDEARRMASLWKEATRRAANRDRLTVHRAVATLHDIRAVLDSHPDQRADGLHIDICDALDGGPR